MANEPQQQQKKKSRPARRRPRRLTPTARRRKVAAAVAAGRTVDQTADELGVLPRTVRRDRRLLRRASAGRAPWSDPAGCWAGFIEDAEAALQKVRAAQAQLAKQGELNTLRLNLIKLEWTMLVKFIEMLGPRVPKPNKEKENDEAKDEWADYTDEELLDAGRQMGIDVEPFERILRAAGRLDADAPDDGAHGPGRQAGGEAA
jgi:predicted transcriptional regulator